MPGRPSIVVMGVAGCGKSTAAKALDEGFIEGDLLHPDANRRKMEGRRPLNDDDRAPWLAAIAELIAAARGHRGLVISCSALKRRYRDRLRSADNGLYFVHLALDKATALERAARRTDHFMPPDLVASQFDDLEPLESDEAGLTVDARLPTDQIVRSVLDRLEADG